MRYPGPRQPLEIVCERRFYGRTRGPRKPAQRTTPIPIPSTTAVTATHRFSRGKYFQRKMPAPTSETTPGSAQTASGTPVSRSSQHSSHPASILAPKIGNTRTPRAAVIRKLDKYPMATSTGCAFHFAHKKQQAKTTT